MHHEEQFYEIILNLGQWFRRRCFNDFLSGALAVLLFGAVKPFLKEGIMGNVDVKLYGILTSGSKGDISYLEL